MWRVEVVVLVRVEPVASCPKGKKSDNPLFSDQRLVKPSELRSVLFVNIPSRIGPVMICLLTSRSGAWEAQL